MATVNSSTSSSSNMFSMYGVKSKGIGGLATGLDTDSLVEALTSGTRAKIAAQSQKKQLLNWKVTAYRNTSAAMQAYQKKYLSYSSTANTNIMSNAFFNTYKGTSSSDKVSVSANANSALGDFTIDYIGQLAKSETLSTNDKSKLSTDLAFGLKVGEGVTSATAFTGRILQLDLDGSGVPKNIKLDSLNKFIKTEAVTTTVAVTDENGDPTYDEYDAPITKDVISYTYTLAGSYTDADGTHSLKDELQSLMTEAFGKKNVYKADGSKELDANDKAVMTDKVTVTIKDGKIVLDSDASKISVYSACSALGMDKGATNRVNMTTKIGDISTFKALDGDVFKFSINGTEISVSKNDTLETLRSKINSSSAGVRFDYNEFTDEFTLTAKSTGAGSNIDIRDTQGNMMNSLFGVEGGGGLGTNWLTSEAVPASDKKVSEFTAADLKNIAKNLSSMEFSLTIDGVTKLVRADTSDLDSEALTKGNISVSNVLSAINKGIQNAFAGTSVKFAMETEVAVNGDNKPINDKGEVLDEGEALFYRYTDRIIMTAKDGVAYAASASTTGSLNALSALGVNGNAIGNTVLNMGYSNDIKASEALSPPTGENAIGGDTSGVFSVTINGETKELEIFKFTSTAFNDALKKAFGSTIASQVKFSVGTDGKLNLHTNDSNMAVSIGRGTTVGQKKDIYDALGFKTTGTDGVENADGISNVNTGTNNGISFSALKDGSKLEDGMLTFTSANGQEIGTVKYSSETNLQDFLAQINELFGDPTAATIINGRLSIKSPDGYINVTDNLIGSDDKADINTKGNLLTTFFGTKDNTYEASAADTTKSTRDEGKDAEIVINGRTLTSSTNTFTINGASVTVNGVSSVGDSPINISVKSDPNDVVDRLKSWIEDYNGLIATLNSMIYEGKSKGYEPLSDEQKAEMTEDQIKTWEAEAKKGILRNDQTLAKIIDDLRNAMYKKVESAGISLFEVGITTKSHSYTDITQAGQLQISDENKLRSMLEKDPDKVRMLFTDSTDGLAVRMNNLINAATSTSSVNRGSLARLAGTETLTGDNTSVLGKQIDAIDTYVTTLKTRLQSEYDRYWRQFSSLETAIQKMNSQSSWLSQS